MPKNGTLRSRANFTALDLAFGAALAEAARHQNAVDILQEDRGVVALEHFAVDPVQMHLHIVGQAAMGQRLGQRFVAVLDLHVFADHGDAHFAFGILHPLHHLLPARQIGLRRILDAEHFQQLGVEPDLVIGQRHAIDGVQVQGRDHPLGRQIAEQADLAAVVVREWDGEARHSRISGWMPMARNSLTLCWVGLVFSSPAASI